MRLLATLTLVAWLASATCLGSCAATEELPDMERPILYTFTLLANGTPEAWDEAMAAACLQGLINRDAPSVYVLTPADKHPALWLDVFTKDGRWLEGRPQQALESLTALRELAGDKVKGAVIWDPEVPATVNVANTIAGVEDGVVLSPEFADRYLAAWKLPVLRDLRGMFGPGRSGSAKNEAYRWAIRRYLAEGKCSPHWLCLYEDSYSTRATGNIGYVITRDWAVYNKAFVYDLSPWGDEAPKDDPGQPVGTDLETYHLMLAANLEQTKGEQMTEVAGFFAFNKYSNMPGYPSSHEPVPTEWETVYVISPYNCYQNTVASDCYNQSLHSQAPIKPLKQSRPAKLEQQDKDYLCILMADMDSATPLYAFMPHHWADEGRGKLPLDWGVNPNLIETYPDVISYFYETATSNDHFTADASAAGYMNPNRVKPEYMDLFVRHNKHFYDLTDMTMSPMVLDWDEPTAAVKDAFTKFSKEGFATIVMDMHGTGGKHPERHVWKGMPVMELLNHACNFGGVQQTAVWISNGIPPRTSAKGASFHFFRIVWTDPSKIIDTIEELKRIRPDLKVQVLDPYNFFRLVKENYED